MKNRFHNIIFYFLMLVGFLFIGSTSLYIYRLVFGNISISNIVLILLKYIILYASLFIAFKDLKTADEKDDEIV